jgi:hypothetical protein
MPIPPERMGLRVRCNHRMHAIESGMVNSGCEEGFTVPIRDNLPPQSERSLLNLFEPPPQLIEPAVRACRLFNTALDVIFYHVPTLAAQLAEKDAPMRALEEKPPSRIVQFDAPSDPECSLLLIDANTAPYVHRYTNVELFLASPYPETRAVEIATITGVGSSSLGSAAVGHLDRARKIRTCHRPGIWHGGRHSAGARGMVRLRPLRLSTCKEPDPEHSRQCCARDSGHRPPAVGIHAGREDPSRRAGLSPRLRLVGRAACPPPSSRGAVQASGWTQQRCPADRECDQIPSTGPNTRTPRRNAWLPDLDGCGRRQLLSIPWAVRRLGTAQHVGTQAGPMASDLAQHEPQIATSNGSREIHGRGIPDLTARECAWHRDTRDVACGRRQMIRETTMPDIGTLSEWRSGLTMSIHGTKRKLFALSEDSYFDSSRTYIS